MAIAVNGLGVKFMYGADEANVEIPELKEMPEFGVSPEKIETTHLASKMKTYIQGIGDPGDMEFKFNYDATVYGEILALGNAEQKVKVILSDGASFSFAGQFSIKYNGGGVNSVAEMTVSIAMTEELVYEGPQA